MWSDNDNMPPRDYFMPTLSPWRWVGLALAFQGLRERGARAGPAALTGFAVLWNLALTIQVRTGLLSQFRQVSFGELLAGQLHALRRIPHYLWAELRTPWSAVHEVVHRDSPVSPRWDPSPGWLIPAVLILCWVGPLLLLWMIPPSSARRG